MLDFKLFSHYTEEQALSAIALWGISDPLPKANRSLLIAFPNRTAIRITKSGKLYAMEYAV